MLIQEVIAYLVEMGYNLYCDGTLSLLTAVLQATKPQSNIKRQQPEVSLNT